MIKSLKKPNVLLFVIQTLVLSTILCLLIYDSENVTITTETSKCIEVSNYHKSYTIYYRYPATVPARVDLTLEDGSVLHLSGRWAEYINSYDGDVTITYTVITSGFGRVHKYVTKINDFTVN